MGKNIMGKNIYIRFGKPYRKLDRNESIPIGSMHSFCGGELHPIINPKTIGDKPSSFSFEREFYAPIKETKN